MGSSYGDRLKLLFIVDARSPIAQNWIRFFLSIEDEVHVISTARADSFDPRLASFTCLPVAFANVATSTHQRSRTTRQGLVQRVLKRSAAKFSRARTMLGAYDVLRHRDAYAERVRAIGPDLVHAMRIPYEGVIAAAALDQHECPLVVSTWGNDLTLYATSSRRIAGLTHMALRRADVLHSDCRRDLELASKFGWEPTEFDMVLPGNGGIESDLFRPGAPDQALLSSLGVSSHNVVVVNPRGLRPYVRNDNFFRAAAEVASQVPEVVFLCAAMEGEPVAESWVRQYNLEAHVRLLPFTDRSGIARLFRSSAILVSPSDHDGTPNTLLEGMAAGAFPVVGAIDSVREWIVDGENGLTCDQSDWRSIADAMIRAVQNTELRRVAAIRNAEIIASRASYPQVMSAARATYCNILSGQSSTWPLVKAA